MKIGIIAEDDSDVAVVRELTLMGLKPHQVGFSRFVGDGCGKLRRKCQAWARILVQQGCQWIIVVHDLDEYQEFDIRKQLTKAVNSANPQISVVLLPKHEIEAWLLYDSKALAQAFNETRRLELPGDPEAILDPKRYLRDIIWRIYRKDYLNTIHNERIARGLRVGSLRASKSFAPHPDFVAKVKSAIDESKGSGVARKRRPLRNQSS